MAEKKKVIRQENADQVFVYCGDGMGVAGLPHRITLKQAEDRGLLSELEAGIENGAYKPDAVKPAGEVEE